MSWNIRCAIIELEKIKTAILLLAYISMESKLDYLTIINTIPHVYLIETSKMICVHGGLLCE